VHQWQEAADQLRAAITLNVSRPAQASAEGQNAEAMTVDALGCAEWDAMVAAHPQSTIFHSGGWARVLRDTYGHRPFFMAHCEGQRLAGLLPVMEVSSWLTGRRGVSLPFTDFCPALTSAGCDGGELYRRAMETGRQRRWKRLECRGFDDAWAGARPSLSFYGHRIDLGAGEAKLFRGLEGAMRRGVRKAEQMGVKVEFDAGAESMRSFFTLHCRTRRRHGLPPQPWRFFLNIQRHLLSLGRGFIATARLEGRALAAAVFLHDGRQALYKFGASDYESQQARPNNLMMWAAMRHCAERGLATLNLGRTSLSNEGLRRFKLGLGAVEEEIRYMKYDFSSEQFVGDVDHAEGWHNRVFARLPLPVLRLAGAVLYPHLS
jgi:CelD/BcsL family acetyltransferase involved in cellulose biosynthesis